MKKNIILSLLAIFMCFSLVGCEKKIKHDNDIVRFQYHYGSYNSGYYEYNITMEDEKIMFTANGYNGVNLNINKEIEISYLEKLSKIINDNSIDEWDGFDESDPDVLDGYSFTLKVEYENGEVLEANGYMKYPKNYDNGHKSLTKFLETIQ